VGALEAVGARLEGVLEDGGFLFGGRLRFVFIGGRLRFVFIEFRGGGILSRN